MDPTELAAVFGATGDRYAAIAPLLWDPAGAATVLHTAPVPGERVLDACCGSGASALPATLAVGPAGSVDAVDVTGPLLATGRAAARQLGLTNVHFVQSDVTRWHPDEPYDLVQCVFGVFLLPDLDRDTAHLAGLLRPGGRLGVTVWAAGALEKFGHAFHDVLARHRPEPAEPLGATPIERINTEPLLADWLGSLGLRDIVVHRHTHAITLTPRTAWDLVLGTGFRGALAGLDTAAIESVRTDLLAALAERGLDTEDTSSVIGVGYRAAVPTTVV